MKWLTTPHVTYYYHVRLVMISYCTSYVGAIFIHSVSFMGISKGKLSFFVFFYCHFLHEGPKSLRCPLSHRLSKNRGRLFKGGLALTLG
jgi:hypothetical protein